MKTVQLNIGLNNNPIDVVEYLCELKTLRLMAYYIKDKTFNGEVEPTVCARLEIIDECELIATIEKMCVDMTQESIAASTDDAEALIFHPEYSGYYYEFNPELFEYL